MRAAALALTVLALAASGRPDASARGDALGFERGRVTVSTKDGRQIPLRVEIARTPAERSRGLSGRRALARDAGMLFVYPRTGRRSFWMRGTHIPLAVAVMDGRGRILRTLRMEPCRADPCPLYDPGVAFRSALEVNAGWFARRRVGRGDVVRLSLR